MDKEKLKELVNVDLSVKQAIQEKESTVVETRYYKEFVINTEMGPLVLEDMYITIERNKEGDMEYHFRWVQENENGEKTIEEKIALDKDGNIFCIDGFKEVLGDGTLDVDSIFNENDKEKGRLGGIIREEKNKDKAVDDKQEQKQEKDDEEKKAKQDLKEQGQDLRITNFRKITDKHLEERMPEVFNNDSEYAMAYSETLGSFVILQKHYQMNENGELSEKWELNENVQTAGTNYEPIISINENGERIEQKVPLALLKTSENNKEIAITLDAKNYGELDMETVEVMPCGNDTIHDKKRVARPVGMKAEGNLQGDGVESMRQRYDFDYDSGKDFNGTSNKAHAIAHGATEIMEESGGIENGVIADEEQEIPGTSLTFGDLSKITGMTIQELIEHEGREDVSIMDIAQDIEEKIKEEAEANKMSVEGYKKELKKAPGKNLKEKMENANEAIQEQYMGSSGRSF